MTIPEVKPSAIQCLYSQTSVDTSSYGTATMYNVYVPTVQYVQ
jgi:hypothetical protein